MYFLAAGAANGWVNDFVEQWGHLGVFIFLVVENLFPPLPSELILPLSGYYVDQGTLNFPLLLFASTAGSVVGAMILYLVGQRAGRPVLERWGHKVRITPKDLDRADEWFARYGLWVIFFGRLIPGVRSLVSIPAGAASMPIGVFLALTTAGSALWNALLIGAGWSLGSEWDRITSIVDSGSTVVLAIMVVTFVAGASVFLWRRRRSVTTDAT